MARQKSHSRKTLVENAMHQFWAYGFSATSMDDLVSATHVSRGGIYADFGGKKDLFLACLAHYGEQIVAPARAYLEAEDAGLDAIATFFETQIARAELAGLPGSGCLVANTATETAPHDTDIAAQVAEHHARLRAGFAHALSNEGRHLPQSDIDALADFLVVTAQGLWSMSRTVRTAEPLRAHVSTTLSLLTTRLSRMTAKPDTNPIKA